MHQTGFKGTPSVTNVPSHTDLHIQLYAPPPVHQSKTNLAKFRCNVMWMLTMVAQIKVMPY